MPHQRMDLESSLTVPPSGGLWSWSARFQTALGESFALYKGQNCHKLHPPKDYYQCVASHSPALSFLDIWGMYVACVCVFLSVTHIHMYGLSLSGPCLCSTDENILLLQHENISTYFAAANFTTTCFIRSLCAAKELPKRQQ